MAFQDGASLKGQLEIVLKDQSGKVKERRKEKNLIVNTGLNAILDRLVGTSEAVMSHMGLGSSSTAAAAGPSARMASTSRAGWPRTARARQLPRSRARCPAAAAGRRCHVSHGSSRISCLGSMHDSLPVGTHRVHRKMVASLGALACRLMRVQEPFISILSIDGSTTGKGSIPH